MSYFLCQSGPGCACCAVPIFRLSSAIFRRFFPGAGDFVPAGFSCRAYVVCHVAGYGFYVVTPSFRKCIPPHLRCSLPWGIYPDYYVVLCSRKDAVFSAGHSVVFVVLVFRQERFRLCGGIVLRNSPVSGGRRQSAPCPEGFPFTPFSAITRQLVAAAIKKMKNAAFETAIIQYRILFRCIPEQKEGVRYLAVANPSG